MRRILPILVVSWIVWTAVHPPALAREEQPTLATLQSNLTHTQERVQQLEARVAALEAAGAAQVLEDRPSTDPSTQVFTLDRVYMEERLLERALSQIGEDLASRPADEAERMREALRKSVRRQFQAFDLRIELRADRSALIVRRAKGGTSTDRGIWTRSEGRVIFTLTHKNGAALKTAELMFANDDGGALELPGGSLPFPIRATKRP